MFDLQVHLKSVPNSPDFHGAQVNLYADDVLILVEDSDLDE